MTTLDPRRIVRTKIRAYNAKAWTMSDKMIGAWLAESLGRLPTAAEKAAGLAEYNATKWFYVPPEAG